MGSIQNASQASNTVVLEKTPVTQVTQVVLEKPWVTEVMQVVLEKPWVTQVMQVVLQKVQVTQVTQVVLPQSQVKQVGLIHHQAPRSKQVHHDLTVTDSHTSKTLTSHGNAQQASHISGQASVSILAPKTELEYARSFDA